MQEFAEQVAALRPYLMRCACRRLCNDAQAEDVVSETIVAALAKPAAFGGRASLKTWLVGILKNKAVDQMRRDAREALNPIGVDAGGQDDRSGIHHEAAIEPRASWGDPLESLSQFQFMARIDASLKSLSNRSARAFLLHHWMEHETAEICTELGVTANHLGVILNRTRSHLRASLRAQRFPDASGAPAEVGPSAEVLHATRAATA